MEPLRLFYSKKEVLYFSLILFTIFTVNIFNEYKNFKIFTNEEVFKTDALVLNLYKKQNHTVVKLQTKNFTCFTSIDNKTDIKKLDLVNIYLISQNLNFLDYLKGFYTSSFNISSIKKDKSIKDTIVQNISTQHNDQNITSVYSALFLAINSDKVLRDQFASLGISHLIAISGFHLGVFAAVLYFLLNIFYSPIHQHYLPYRNKKLDILSVSIIILVSYLILIDNTPSFLRSLVMFVFAIVLLRSNIKVLSFSTLFIITALIIALFPKLLFSLSLWFSLSGVFYIFLFIHYFKDLNKYIQIVLFNFWVFFAMNPITHYFFGTTSYEQLLSPVLTVLFTIFYPLSGFFHIFGFGSLFDEIISYLIYMKIESFEIFTPFWFFILYILTSFLSIISKKGFYSTNVLFVSFNLWLYI